MWFNIYQQYFRHQLVKSGLTIRQCDLAGICVSRTLNRVTIAVWTDASTGNSVVALFSFFSCQLYRNYQQEITRQNKWDINIMLQLKLLFSVFL